MENINLRIGVFDSGVGGLSVLAEIIKALPEAEYFYCSDNLNFPYGTKDDATVRACALDVVSRFQKAARLELVVIACNTASTIALEDLRAQLTIPVVGVVPAIKPAAEATLSGVVGILATPATIRRPYLDDLIQNHASHCRVLRFGSSACVEWAEEKLRGGAIPLSKLTAELSAVTDAVAQGMDQLVLGCTHFPLIAAEIRAVLPAGVSLVDSGAAVAQRVLSLSPPNTHSGLMGRPLRSMLSVEGYCSGPSFEVSLNAVVTSLAGTLRLRTLG